MTIGKSFITLMLLLITGTLSHTQTVVDPIADIIPASPPDSADDPYFSQRVIVKCVGDFNSDGIPDLAVSDELLWGNAGGLWEIYLGQPGGGYKKLDDLFFHPLAINIQKARPGTSKVKLYLRMSAEDGNLVEYSVSQGGIKEISSVGIVVDRDKPDSPATRLYMSLFTDTSHMPVVSCCNLSELCKNPKAMWRSGY